jgi:hypothetical protein
MISRTTAFCLLVLLPAAALAAPPPAAAPSPQPGSWESYRVLSERNLFTRDRSRHASSRRSSSVAAPSAPVSTGDSSIVLTGIIQQGEDCVAFFEDTRTGKTTAVQTGATVGKGRLTLITQDIVHYACDGDLRRIEIGSTLAGTPASFPRLVTPTTTSAPAAARPAVPAVPAPATAAGAPGAAPTAPATTPAAISATPAAASLAPAAAAAADGTTLPPPTTPPPAVAAPSSGGNMATIEERMRQRREQELNR